MNSEQIEGLIKYIVLVSGSCTTVIIPLWKYFEYKKVQARETSLGETKSKHFEEAIIKFTNEMATLLNRVDRLTEKYDELIEKITDKFLDR